MKVLFLDFDGVINSDQYSELNSMYLYDRKQEDYYNQALAKNIDLLCKEFDLKIVISSTWRTYYSEEELLYILRYMKISADLIGTTIDTGLGISSRSFEIDNWLEENEYSNYLIIDDQEKVGIGHSDHFIKTNCSVGFDSERLEYARQFCNSLFKKDLN